MKKFLWYMGTSLGLAIVVFALFFLWAYLIELISPAGDAASRSGKTGLGILGVGMFLFVVMIPAMYYLMLVGVIKKMSYRELGSLDLSKQRDFIIVSVLAMLLGSSIFFALTRIFP